MKTIKILFGISLALTVSFFLLSADHTEVPGVNLGTSDITDFYAFRGQNTDNVVFIANLQGFLSPGDTSGASFDENVLVEFNIDTDGDAIEDLVIQAIPRDGKMYFFGPTASTTLGLSSTIATNNQY